MDDYNLRRLSGHAACPSDRPLLNEFSCDSSCNAGNRRTTSCDSGCDESECVAEGSCTCRVNGRCAENEACAQAGLLMGIIIGAVVIVAVGIHVYRRYVKRRRAASRGVTPGVSRAVNSGMPVAQAQAVQPMPMAQA